MIFIHIYILYILSALNFISLLQVKREAIVFIAVGYSVPVFHTYFRYDLDDLNLLCCFIKRNFRSSLSFVKIDQEKINQFLTTIVFSLKSDSSFKTFFIEFSQTLFST